jgi:hypothetical protein
VFDNKTDIAIATTFPIDLSAVKFRAWQEEDTDEEEDE